MDILSVDIGNIGDWLQQDVADLRVCPRPLLTKFSLHCDQPLVAGCPLPSISHVGSDEVRLPGTCILTVEQSTPIEAYEAIRICMMDGRLAVQVEREDARALELSAAAFQDFVLLHVEVCVTAAKVGGNTVVILKDVSRNDVVRFAHFCSEVASSLRSVGLDATLEVRGSPGKQLTQLSFHDDMGFKDFSEDILDASCSWLDVLVPICDQAFNAATPSVREEAIQALACWALHEPACHKVLTDLLVVEHRGALCRILGCDPGPSPVFLAEAYPLAAVLRTMSVSSEVVAKVSPWQPLLVQRELHQLRGRRM